jgi:hypothetical protein
MDPQMFVAEVYRRMALRMDNTKRMPPSKDRIEEVAEEYGHFLPSRKDAAILDLGFGDGWFMAACLKLGYTNISGAEFAPENKPYLRGWGVTLHKRLILANSWPRIRMNTTSFICRTSLSTSPNIRFFGLLMHFTRH